MRRRFSALRTKGSARSNEKSALLVYIGSFAKTVCSGFTTGTQTMEVASDFAV